MAINSDNQNLSFGEFVGVLHGLVRDGRTGTVFFLADSRHYARIGLQQGRIATVVYGKHKAQEALDYLVQSESGVYSFAENVIGSAREHALPPTSLLLQWLHDAVFAKEAGGMERPLLPDGPPSLAFETNGEELFDGGGESGASLEEGAALRLSGDALYETVTRELARYIGPVAPMVTSDFRMELLAATTIEQVRETLDQIAEDIGDGKQADAFRAAILGRLMG